MKRIISKIDYDMQKLANTDSTLALELWERIKGRKFIIDGALEIVTDKNSRKKSFFAPAICHMILSNPQDIDPEVYDNLVITLLKNTDLNRITVFNDLSFLDLIVLNGTDNLDDYFVRLLNSELKNKTNKKPFSLRYVDYAEVPSSEEKLMIFKDDSFNIGLDKREIEAYTSRDYISIIDSECFDEAKVLMDIVKVNPNQGESVISTIESIYEASLSRKVQERLVRVPKVAVR